MKKIFFFLVCMGFWAILGTTTTSCKTKEGCGLEEKYAPPTDRDGSMTRKKGKSNLFSKKQRKRMGG